MGACIWKRVVYDMSCKRFQFFVNVEALTAAPSHKYCKSTFLCERFIFARKKILQN